MNISFSPFSVEVSILDYLTPQQQQTDVGVPSGPTGGDTWAIKVTAEESGTQPFPRRTFEVQVDDGEAAADIVTKFADAINTFPTQINDENEPTISANDNGSTLEITADDVGDIFDVATRGFDANSITVVTNPTEGVGTPEQVSEREGEDDGTVGRYVQSTNLLGSLDGPATYTDPNGEYRLHTFSFDGDSEKAVNKSIARQSYIVALESAVLPNQTESATGAATDDTIDDYAEFLAPLIVANDLGL